MKSAIRFGVPIVLIAIAITVFWNPTDGPDNRQRDAGTGRVAVETAVIETGPVTDRRELTGTLEPDSAFTVAPNISGRIERVHVDIGDPVDRGDLLVELNDDEARQAVAEAEAMLAVARAEHAQTISDAELAEREFERTRVLASRDLASQSELDAARARATAEHSAVAVAEARVSEREAARRGANIRLAYTRVRASWPNGGDQSRVVGERMVSTGDTVAANAALLTILSVDPLRAVIYAPERDYAVLRRGQSAHITANALPGREFAGEVRRIAPRFDPASRQARVEVELSNPEGLLKPGMFITARIEIDRAESVTLVPVEALARRDGRDGIYRVADGNPPRAEFIPVTVGIESDDHAEIVEPALSGRVITLGQQLLEDGTPLNVVDNAR